MILTLDTVLFVCAWQKIGKNYHMEHEKLNIQLMFVTKCYSKVLWKSKMIWTPERLEPAWFIHLKELAHFKPESIGGFSATYINRLIALLAPIIVKHILR